LRFATPLLNVVAASGLADRNLGTGRAWSPPTDCRRTGNKKPRLGGAVVAPKL